MQAAGGSIRAGEVEKFDALAARWWDPAGPMRPLHMMNATRAGWILDRIARHQGAGARVLDIGCGAGLLSEALAKAGCDVLGIDAAGEAIAAARAHAAGRGFKLTYQTGTAEDLAAAGHRFPVITALEIIEHVENPAAFIATLASLLEPGGLLFISTLNRSKRSYLTAKIGAEFLLRLLPLGTHDWRHFITPVELGALCRAGGLRLADIAGMRIDPLRQSFTLTRDTSVNYIAMATA